MNYKRITPLILPIIIWLLCETFFRFPSLFYCSISLGVLVIILGIKFLADKNNWLMFLATPIFFFLSFSAYATMISSRFWIHSIFLLIVWFLFVYLRNLYYYFSRHETEPDWRNKLQSILIAGGFLTVFASSSLIFGLPAFLSWATLAMLPALALIIWLLLFQLQSILAVDSKQEPRLLALSVLILVEMAWGISLLPLNFNILGIFLAIDYYLCLMVMRFYSRGVLNRRSLKLPLIISGAVVLLLLFTSRWL